MLPIFNKIVCLNSYLDEERIREITRSLSEIETLARVIDGEYLQGTESFLFPITRMNILLN